ncbi:MAG: hypothetical protein KDI00_05480, partial [Pseudomonadales bacterium]|nr:hypothetical protein [Pseudomonadales bacterium]
MSIVIQRFILLVWCLLSQFAIANQDLIVRDTKQNLARHAWYLEDKTQQQTIDDVLKESKAWQ